MVDNNNNPYHEFLNPYQTQMTPQLPPPRNQGPVSPPKMPQKKSSFVTKKAAVGLLAASLMFSAILGFGGGFTAATFMGSGSSNGSGLNTVNASPTSAKSSTGTGNKDDLSLEEIVEKTQDSVVEIRTEAVKTGQFMQQYVSEGAGSGVIISADGYIVTNNHVIEGASKITVTLKDGADYQATLVGTDSQSDVALLKINAAGLTAATLGNSSELQVGSTAVVIGNPLGELGGTVTNGIISALDRNINLDGKTMNLMQTNAAINPGNSGGGLFNGQGELVGVVVAKTSATEVEGLGFAIPIDDVKKVVEELSKNGYVSGRVDLKMTLVDVTSEEDAMMYRVSRLGVYVSKVESGSAAESAGFQSGDCITAVNGTEVGSSAELQEQLNKYKVGDTVQFTVVRQNRTGTLSLTLEEQTASSGGQGGFDSQNGAGGRDYEQYAG